jgi:hypothetical protein
MKKQVLLALLLQSLVSSRMNGQAEFPKTISFGWPVINERLTEGVRYQPYQCLVSMPVRTWGRSATRTWSIFLEPQFVLAEFKPRGKTNVEFGVNTGIAWQQRVAERVDVRAAVGTGPHFITVETRQQARGFIFSDNFSLGVIGRPRVAGRLSGHLTARFRHISNANLFSPNKGIDTWFLLAGVVLRP